MTATEVNLSTTISPELTAAGTALTERMLLAWAAESADEESSGTNLSAKEATVKLAQELERLEKCFAGFAEEREKSEWAQVVLSQTY